MMTVTESTANTMSQPIGKLLKKKDNHLKIYIL